MQEPSYLTDDSGTPSAMRLAGGVVDGGDTRQGGAAGFAAESSARKRFLERIEATDDFDVLVYGIATDIECSDLRGATKHSLLKRLAKKAGVSLASLREGRSGICADMQGGG